MPPSPTSDQTPRPRSARAARRARRRPLAALALVTLGSLAACSTGGGATATPGASSGAGSAGPGGSSATSAASPTPSVSTPAEGSCAALAQQLSLPEQAGQLLMVGVQGDIRGSGTDQVISKHHVGSVVLLGDKLGGRTDVSVLASDIVGLSKIPVLVSVDQEGGKIQRLSGSGFTEMPSATDQSRWPLDKLTTEWTRWSKELSGIGVKYNLAPVGDVVPAAKEYDNEPIGLLDRSYGTDAASAGPKVAAVVKGMTAGRTASSVKHFPGLGQVTTNTDFGIARDTTIGRKDPGLGVFSDAIDAGVSSVMVSSAIYTKIDPKQQAVFSPTVITTMLRGDLGWQGVVISDDLGAAESVAGVPAGDRATRFVQAGGDLVINANPQTIDEMATALVTRAKKDPAFAAKVKASATRVLAMKAKTGSLECTA